MTGYLSYSLDTSFLECNEKNKVEKTTADNIAARCLTLDKHKRAKEMVNEIKIEPKIEIEREAKKHDSILMRMNE